MSKQFQRIRGNKPVTWFARFGKLFKMIIRKTNSSVAYVMNISIMLIFQEHHESADNMVGILSCPNVPDNDLPREVLRNYDNTIMNKHEKY